MSPKSFLKQLIAHKAMNIANATRPAERRNRKEEILLKSKTFNPGGKTDFIRIIFDTLIA